MKKTVLAFFQVLCLFLIVFLTGLSSNKASGIIFVIYIRADGSIDPPMANITSVDNVTYTFTDNIHGLIIVERDNIVIDGLGYRLQGPAEAGIHLSGRTNVTIKNSEIKEFSFGVRIHFSRQCAIRDNIITNNTFYGVELRDSEDNVLTSNNLTNNHFDALLLWNTNGTVIAGNNMSDNQHHGMRARYSNENVIENNRIINNNSTGIWFISDSNNNTITGNIIANHSLFGIRIRFSSNNIIHHNNFLDNSEQVGSYGTNVWDDGYPSGGNYWSDYNGTDLFSGLYQNETGSDGIGDTPYIINEWHSEYDNYPSVFPFGSETEKMWTSYRNLFFKYTEVSSDFEALNQTLYELLSNITNLQAKYDSLLATVDDMQGQLDWLNSTCKDLQESMDYLIITFNSTRDSLQGQINSLNSTFQMSIDDLQERVDSLNLTLQTSVSELQEQYNSLNSTLTSGQEDIINELNTIRNLMYVFIATTVILIATTVILIATTVYLAIRKPKIKPQAR